MSTTLEDTVIACMKEKHAILEANLTAVVSREWQLNGFSVEPDATSTERYPLVAHLRFDHVSLTDPYDENRALGIDGGDKIIDWLIGLGVVDGTVEVRINEVPDGASKK